MAAGQTSFYGKLYLGYLVDAQAENCGAGNIRCNDIKLPINTLNGFMHLSAKEVAGKCP
jgi:hypothetical protein